MKKLRSSKLPTMQGSSRVPPATSPSRHGSTIVPMHLLPDAWKNYMGALNESLDPVAFNQLKALVMRRAEDVAESAGGFLGLGNKVSDAERKVLDDLAS